MSSKQVLGKRVPDLVLVMDRSDNMFHLELRVQCEVPLDEAEAAAVFEAIYKPGNNQKSDAVTKAHAKIKDKLGHQTPEFQEMVNLAFKGNGSTLP